MCSESDKITIDLTIDPKTPEPSIEDPIDVDAIIDVDELDEINVSEIEKVDRKEMELEKSNHGVRVCERKKKIAPCEEKKPVHPENRLENSKFFKTTSRMPMGWSEFRKYCRKDDEYTGKTRPWTAFDYANGVCLTSESWKNRTWNTDLYNAYLNYDLDFIANNSASLMEDIKKQAVSQ